MQEWTVFQWIGVAILGAIPVAAVSALIWWFADEDGFKRGVAPFRPYFHLLEIALFLGLIAESLIRLVGGNQGALSSLMLWVIALVGASAHRWQQKRRRTAA